MPDPISHTAGALGAVTAGIAFVFDVPSATLFAAFSGSCLGLAMSQKSQFIQAVTLVFIGTLIAGYMTPVAVKFLGNYPSRGVAFAIALCVIWDTSRGWVLDMIKRCFGSVFGGGK